MVNDDKPKKLTEMPWTEISRFVVPLGALMVISLGLQIYSLWFAHMTPIVEQPTPEYCKITSKFISDLIGINLAMFPVMAFLVAYVIELKALEAKLETRLAKLESLSSQNT